MFLVTFPSLVTLTVTDQHVLASSLRRVQVDGIVSIPEVAAISLSSLWRRRFRSINIGAQVLGVGVGMLLALFNYIAYTPDTVGYWIAAQNRLSLPQCSSIVVPTPTASPATAATIGFSARAIASMKRCACSSPAFPFAT